MHLFVSPPSPFSSLDFHPGKSYSTAMNIKLSSTIEEILKKGADFAGISRQEAQILMGLELQSLETYALMETANRMSRSRFGNKGEKHFHIGLNVEPCPMDCKFCSLTRQAGIFTEKIAFSEEEIVGWAKQGEAEGADALNIMTTGTYPFSRLLDSVLEWPIPGIWPSDGTEKDKQILQQEASHAASACGLFAAGEA